MQLTPQYNNTHQTNPTVSDVTNAGQNKLAQFGFPDKNALNDQLTTLTKPAI
jgi:hypothetical protein